MSVQVEGKRKFFRLLDSKEKEINRLKKKIVDLQELLDERTWRVVTLNQEIERLQTIITDRNHRIDEITKCFRALDKFKSDEILAVAGEVLRAIKSR